MLKVRVYFHRKEIAMIQLEKLVKKNLPKEKEGKVASYIPALAEVNPKQLGIALYDLEDGEVGEAGQSEVRFAIESISKVITLMLAIKKMGIQEVFKHVGSRQTGFAFNSILNMEIERAKYPLNPFINAGAIATTSMVVSKTGDDAFEEILDFARDICNDPEATKTFRYFNAIYSYNEWDCKKFGLTFRPFFYSEYYLSDLQERM